MFLVALVGGRGNGVGVVLHWLIGPTNGVVSMSLGDGLCCSASRSISLDHETADAGASTLFTGALTGNRDCTVADAVRGSVAAFCSNPPAADADDTR